MATAEHGWSKYLHGNGTWVQRLEQIVVWPAVDEGSPQIREGHEYSLQLEKKPVGRSSNTWNRGRLLDALTLVIRCQWPAKSRDA